MVYAARLGFRGLGLQGYLAHKNPPPPWDHRRALGIVLLNEGRGSGSALSGWERERASERKKEREIDREGGGTGYEEYRLGARVGACVRVCAMRGSVRCPHHASEQKGEDRF